jgi:hypothetical protein
MLFIQNLSEHHSELWKEYTEFLKYYDFNDFEFAKICFIYSNKYFNKGCLTCNNNLTNEELYMYNYSVDDDYNKILVNNNCGIIYAKTIDNVIYAFRFTNQPLCPKKYRLIKIFYEKNISQNHKLLLNKYKFF